MGVAILILTGVLLTRVFPEAPAYRFEFVSLGTSRFYTEYQLFSLYDYEQQRAGLRRRYLT
jgi:hypothetical protein